jgi:serine/threonine protein kinase
MQLQHYEIGDRIGQGGMGEVYRARDTRLNREVAIKVLPALMSSSMARRQRCGFSETSRRCRVCWR